MMILNKYHNYSTTNLVDIMRPGLFGNPFTIGKDGNRDEVVEKHLLYIKERVEKEPVFRQEIKELFGKNLLCCCAPKRCHGDNLKLLCEELNKSS